MNDWILKLTGSTVEPGSTVTGFDLGTAGGVGVEFILLLAVVLLAVVIISYRWMPEEQTATRKGMLVFLRLAFLTLLLGILLQPVSPTSPRHWKGSGTCLRDRGKDVFYFYSFIEMKGEPDFH